MEDRTPGEEVESLPLAQAVRLLLQECRMVLPGIEALFGFQLIAVTQDKFWLLLDRSEQFIHLAATVLVTAAIALVMTPAAYHRQTRPLEVSHPYIRLCSRLLLWSMYPLMLGICLDLYLIARIVTGERPLAAVIAAFMACFYASFWLLMPWRRRVSDERKREREARRGHGDC
ncbi:MAG TPA: DUF6328 family protein [Rhodocyclaceae bacterium]